MLLTTTCAVRPPGRAAYARVAVVLLLTLSGLVGAGAAPSWADSAAAPWAAEHVVRVGAGTALGPAAQTLPMASPSPTPNGQVAADGTSSGGTPKGLVLVLALLTGLLALLALARGGRRPAKDSTPR